MKSIHVSPERDLVEHDTTTDDCICGPRLEFMQYDEGSYWLVAHHALDGRE